MARACFFFLTIFPLRPPLPRPECNRPRRKSSITSDAGMSYLQKLLQGIEQRALLLGTCVEAGGLALSNQINNHSFDVPLVLLFRVVALFISQIDFFSSAAGLLPFPGRCAGGAGECWP